MKLYLTVLFYLVGTILVLGGAACGVFELCGFLADTFVRRVGTLSVIGTVAVCVALVLHGTFAYYRFSQLPHPFSCSWGDIGAGVLVGCLAMLFMPLGLLVNLADLPLGPAGAIQFLGFLYGLFFGATVTISFLALLVMKVSDAIVEPVCDAIDETAYFLRKKLHLM